MGCRNTKIQYEAVISPQLIEDDSFHAEKSNDFQHVYQKLSSLWPKLPEDDALQLAAILSSRNKLKEVLLPHLLLQREEDTAEVEERFTRSSNTVVAQGLIARVMYNELKDDGAKWMIEKAFSEYVDEFAYGPVETAVQIGNVLLRWDHTSVVIPQLLGEEGGTNSVSPQLSPALLRIGSQPTVGESLPHCHNYDACTDVPIPFSSHEDLDNAIETVINTIFAYNTSLHYKLFSRNSQHFVRSILQSLGIENHRDFFPSHLQDHSQVLQELQRRGCRGHVKEFNSHVELDNYARAHVDEMNSDDVRFCYGSYLLFHAMGGSMLPRGEEESVWRCDKNRCQFKEVQKRY